MVDWVLVYPTVPLQVNGTIQGQNFTLSGGTGSFQTTSSATGSNFATGQGAGSTTTTSATALMSGGASTLNYRVLERGSTASAPATTTDYYSHGIGTQVVGIASSGTHNEFAQLYLKPLSITATAGTGVLTNSSTLSIEGAATGATNNYALFVKSGAVRLGALSAGMVYSDANGLLSVLGTATTSTSGYLTSTDWNTFNNKQAALGFTPYNATNPSGYINQAAGDARYVSLAGTEFLTRSTIINRTTGLLLGWDNGTSSVSPTTSSYVVTDDGISSLQVIKPARNTVVAAEGDGTAAGTKITLTANNTILKLTDDETVKLSDADFIIQTISKGIVMKSPNGTCWRLTPSDAGAAVFTSITCP